MERFDIHQATECLRGVVEDGEPVGHEELPARIKRQAVANGSEVPAVRAVGETPLALRPRREVAGSPQPDLAAGDDGARDLGPGAGGVPLLVHREVVHHHDTRHPVIPADADPRRRGAQERQPGPISIFHAGVIELYRRRRGRSDHTASQRVPGRIQVVRYGRRL